MEFLPALLVNVTNKPVKDCFVHLASRNITIDVSEQKVFIDVSNKH